MTMCLLAAPAGSGSIRPGAATLGRPSMPSRTAWAWIWAAMILVACWIPNEQMPEESSESSFRIPNLDKVIHATLFAGFGYLAMRSGPPSGRRVAVVVAAGLVLAVVSEGGQALPFVHRDAGVEDALADCLGLGLSVGWVWWTSRRGTKP